MTREEFEIYVEEHLGVHAERPFAKDQSTVIFRHAENRKWFAAVMTIQKKHLGIDGDGHIDVVNLKCDPEVIYSVISENGIYPAYHMNKKHWLSVCLDGSVDTDTVLWLLGISYDLTSPKKRSVSE